MARVYDEDTDGLTKTKCMTSYWTDNLPENTIREKIIKRVLTQNMLYGCKWINILKTEVADNNTKDIFFETVIDNIGSFSISADDDIACKSRIIRVFGTAYMKAPGVARIKITDEYDMVKNYLYFSEDKRRILIKDCVFLTNTLFPYDHIKESLYNIQKKRPHVDDIYAFLEVWEQILNQIGVILSIRWEINEVYFNDRDEECNKYDILFRIPYMICEKGGLIEVNIIKREKFYVVIGHKWDFIYDIFELNHNLPIIIKKLICKYLKLHTGALFIRFSDSYLPEDIAGTNDSLNIYSNFVFDLDKLQQYRFERGNELDEKEFYYNGPGYGFSAYEEWCYSYESQHVELLYETTILYDDLQSQFVADEDELYKRWSIKNTYSTLRIIVDENGKQLIVPAINYDVTGCGFDGIISIMCNTPHKYTICLFDRARVFYEKYECDTTKCRLVSMLDIIINTGYTDNNINLIVESNRNYALSRIKYFRTTN